MRGARAALHDTIEDAEIQMHLALEAVFPADIVADLMLSRLERPIGQKQP